ncbi:4578_t:CDS:2, partial [Cetraspora pellucida]
MNYSKVHPANACVVTYCNNPQKTNSCIGKRDPDATVDIDITPKPTNGLFQQLNPNQKHIELHDIVICMNITSYHNEDRDTTFQLETSATENVIITSLISNMKIKFYIIEICDQIVAEQNQPEIGDIIVDCDVQNVQFREYITPHLEYIEEILCKGCELQIHQIEFCIELDKLKVCRLEKNDETDAFTFDQGNYILVIMIDYFDWMYKFKKTAEEPDADKFGETFDIEEENCGIPLFITYLQMELTWKPDFDSTNP